ncbi:hypothetical protein S83_008487, partial [Arachis hypogaea]
FLSCLDYLPLALCLSILLFAGLTLRIGKDGIEPSRAEIFLKIHKRRKDGRPLDEESPKAV